MKKPKASIRAKAEGVTAPNFETLRATWENQGKLEREAWEAADVAECEKFIRQILRETIRRKSAEWKEEYDLPFTGQLPGTPPVQLTAAVAKRLRAKRVRRAEQERKRARARPGWADWLRDHLQPPEDL